MSSSIDQAGELRLVEAIVARLSGAPRVVVGPGDDAAVLRGDGRATVVTIDSQREGVHFETAWIDARGLGRRALAVTLSDLAAMGAEPDSAVVALGLPGSVELAWVEELVDGMDEAARQAGCAIVGGDVTRADRIDIVVSARGAMADRVAPVRRDGARAEDRCWVTGFPGRAGLGLISLLRSGDRLPGAALLEGPDAEAVEHCRRALLEPSARLSFGAAVAAAGLVRAMIDVSDGLGRDLLRLCRASGVGVRLEAGALTGDETLETAAAALEVDPLDAVLGGGEDYELLCAVAPADERAFRESATDSRLEVREIGRFVAAAEGCRVVEGADEHPLDDGGWDPFDGSGEGGLAEGPGPGDGSAG